MRFYALRLMWLPLVTIIAAFLGLVGYTVHALIEVFHD